MVNFEDMFGAIDIGGTKTLIATFNNKGDLLKKIRFETPKGYDEFKLELKNQSENIDIKQLQVMAVAMPGLVNKNKGIGLEFGNLAWENVPIKKDVKDIFNCPVLIENDTKLAGLSESIALKKKYRKVLYVTVSTGIGAGLIVNDKIDNDFDKMEVGHMLFEHDGKLQRWEKFASGKAIVAKFGKPAKDITDPKEWYIIAHNIATGLIDLIAILTPDVIVIGGGVGSHFEKFSDRLNEDLKIYQNHMLTIPPILKATNAEEAVIYGGYYLGKSSYEHANN
jgi:predicted NBD/HSP70 family sugar kinase